MIVTDHNLKLKLSLHSTIVLLVEINDFHPMRAASNQSVLTEHSQSIQIIYYHLIA